MIFPKKLTAADLKHPKDNRSSFNGDKRRPQEEQGFMASRASQGLKTIEGTRKPGNLPDKAKQSPPQARPKASPANPDFIYSPFGPQKNMKGDAPEVIDLTKRQKRQTRR